MKCRHLLFHAADLPFNCSGREECNLVSSSNSWITADLRLKTLTSVELNHFRLPRIPNHTMSFETIKFVDSDV